MDQQGDSPLHTSRRPLSVATFARRLTTDYFVTPCRETRGFSLVDPQLALPSLEEIVPDVSHRVGSSFHYLNLMGARVVPLAYPGPLKKPLIIPATLAYVMHTIVVVLTGIRIHLTVLDEWFRRAVRAPNNTDSMTSQWMNAQQRVIRAISSKRHSQRGNLMTTRMAGLLDPCLTARASPLLVEGQRVLRITRDDVEKNDNYFITQLVKSVIARFSELEAAPVPAAVHPPAKLLLLSDILARAERVLEAVSDSLTNGNLDEQRQSTLLSSTPTDVTIASIMASTGNWLGRHFCQEHPGTELRQKIAVLLLEFHSDICSFFRFSREVSSLDEALLDLFRSVLCPDIDFNQKTVDLSFGLFGHAKSQLYSESNELKNCEQMGDRGVILYQSVAATSSPALPTVVSCSLVRSSRSLQCFRDTIMSSETVSAPVQPVSNGSRAAIFSQRLSDECEAISIRIPVGEADSAVNVYMCSDEERATRKQLLSLSGEE